MKTKAKNLSPSAQRSQFYQELLCVFLSITAVYFVIWSFTGVWPWIHNNYNSYALQANAWLSGRLDLGQNYPHLELAIWDGKYYVSFPPFPSYVMLPFALLFSGKVPEGLINFAVALLGAAYTLKVTRKFRDNSTSAIFWTLFLCIGSNLLPHNVSNGWVWFIAQNMSFTLCMMSVYYALEGKTGRSFAFWACAVGCRPMQILYAPVLAFLILQAPCNQGKKWTAVLKENLLRLIPTLVIALSYMLLNFARFGSIIEFGHNYLPEHIRSENGQFHPSYLRENLPLLFRLPQINKEQHILSYPFANGMAIWLASPIFLSYLFYLLRASIKKQIKKPLLSGMIPLLIVIHLVLLCAHVTMGGSHFGNRYINDTLPFLFLGLLFLLPEKDSWEKAQYPLFMLGLTLNTVGAVLYYMKTFSISL